jgi:2-succinyl-6-hydroxy-2,4-cyclohexadiene-1-carboxylate synthase
MTELITHRHPTPDGTTLVVRTIPGSGNPLVLLHGFTGDGTTMEAVAEGARRGRPAVMIDLIGHGESDAPDRLEPYHMPSVVDQVLSIVGSQPYGTVHLAGYSMGGRVALSMAARAPWYFASVTSISSTAGIDDPVERQARHDADQARADQLLAMGVEAFVEEWLQLPLFAPLVAGLSPDAMAATVTQRNRSTAIGLANSLRATGTGSMPPVWDSLASLRSPLLAMVGSLDERYVELAGRLADVCPFGEHAVIPDAGHALPLENPDAVATLLGDFLEGCEQRG